MCTLLYVNTRWHISTLLDIIIHFFNSHYLFCSYFLQKATPQHHAFPPTTRHRRQAIHELAEAYGCDSQSFDEEPKRSVTVYTTRCTGYVQCVYIHVLYSGKVSGIKFCKFALEQNISWYKFRDLHSGIIRLYCDISKFAG